MGNLMVRGEFESMKILHAVSPKLVPKPVGSGTYESDDDVHLFMCESVDLYDELPNMVDLYQGMAEVHMNSKEHSENSNFGFPFTTCNGTIQQYTNWSSSREEFFIGFLRNAFELEEVSQGPSLEVSEVLPRMFEKVCPRLLRPLETEGRT